jgi:hypothetical protein
MPSVEEARELEFAVIRSLPLEFRTLSRTMPPVTVVFTVVPVNGYSQPVHFSVSGLPAGVTATFSPAERAGAPPAVLRPYVPGVGTDLQDAPR